MSGAVWLVLFVWVMWDERPNPERTAWISPWVWLAFFAATARLLS